MTGIDHIVICCKDLAATSLRFESLGFKLTPAANHPWGTKNRLVQFGDSFLELLAVDNEELIQKSSERAFSFGEFNQKFLASREGGSMVVLTGQGTKDLDRFEYSGLQIYELFKFERIATQSDGAQKKVAFELAFTKSSEMNEIGFFTCRNLYPQNFWNSAFQKHSNSANHLAGIYLVAQNPTVHCEFLSGFSNKPAIRVNDGHFKFQLDNCVLRIVNHAEFANVFGLQHSDLQNEPHIGAIEIALDSFDTAAEMLSSGGLALRNVDNRLILQNFIGITTMSFVPNESD